MWTTIKTWLPVVKVSPRATFRARLKVKCSQLRWRLLMKFLPNDRGYAARNISEDSNSIGVLILNRKSPLGEKGKELHLPQDEVIFAEVQNRGRWEVDEVRFLAKSLNQSNAQRNEQKLFLDIGANSGLVALQVLRKVKSEVRAILIEPIPTHIEAMKFNLSELAQKIRIDSYPYALGSQNAKATIFSEGRNRGNSSLIRGVVPISDSENTEIEMMDAIDFADSYLGGKERIILKCDTQGFDAEILARFPKQIWDRVDAAVIEIWAIPEIGPEHVAQCIARWRGFSYVSWSGMSSGRISLADLSHFWLGKNRDSRNIFLRR